MKNFFSDKKKIVIAIVVFVLLITGLIVAVLILNGHNDDELGREESSLIPEEKKEEIENKILEYQTRIEDLKKKGDNLVTEVYQERVFYLIECGYNEEYKDKILEDLISVDDIEESITSAANVVNYANYFKMTDIYEKYLEILNERKEAEGYEKVTEDVG